jgi:hypothetical protein
MKRFLPLLLGAFLALPLLADDPPADAPPPPEPEVRQDSEIQQEPAVRQEPAVQQDSALVAAAKRNGRGRMPARVITNQTVKASKGHLTTTKTQRPIDLATTRAPAPKPAAKAKPAARKVDAKAAEKREEQKAATAAAAEEGMYDGVEDDPAETEHAAEEAQKPPP